jgi:hypothetical protein
VGFVVDKAAMKQVFLRILSVSPDNHATDCSTLFIIHHHHHRHYPGLVKQAKWWPTYQVDLVSLHPKKLEKKHLPT